MRGYLDIVSARDMWETCERTSRLHSPELGDDAVIVHVNGGL